MAVATIAEAKVADVKFTRPSRAAAVANSADAVQNIVETLKTVAVTTGGNIDHTTNEFVQFTRPVLADYTYEAVGDKVRVLLMDTTLATNTPATYEEWIKTGAGYEKVLTAGGATSGTSGAYNVYAGTSVKVLDLRGKFSTAAGDNRIVYARGQYAGTTAQGEAVRAYSEIQSTADSVHGVHATAEVSTGGSVTGQAVAVRATAATITGLTLSAGALYAITAQTNNVSTALNMTDSAHIRIEDLSTYGMKSIISLGTIIGRSTSKSALGPYSYVSGKMTFTAAGVSAAIRVTTPDGTFYIPMYLQGDVS